MESALLSDYFEHDADVGIIGRGPSVEAAFEHAAEAMFGVMFTLDEIAPVERITVNFEEDDLEIALVQWLNALLSTARIEGIVPSRFRLRREGSRWAGEAEGQRWESALERGVEVKGATLTALAVEQDEDGWEARCVVDV
jgi:SHS2 domain-containing protein